jgi:hypothetical protein
MVYRKTLYPTFTHIPAGMAPTWERYSHQSGFSLRLRSATPLSHPSSTYHLHSASSARAGLRIYTDTLKSREVVPQDHSLLSSAPLVTASHRAIPVLNQVPFCDHAEVPQYFALLVLTQDSHAPHACADRYGIVLASNLSRRSILLFHCPPVGRRCKEL